jgi:hypothetical protein
MDMPIEATLVFLADLSRKIFGLPLEPMKKRKYGKLENAQGL